MADSPGFREILEHRWCGIGSLAKKAPIPSGGLPKGSAKAAADGGSAEPVFTPPDFVQVVATAHEIIIPVVVAIEGAGAGSSFGISRPLAFDYAVRGVSISVEGNGAQVDFRTTVGESGDQTSWDNGSNLWPSLGQGEFLWGQPFAQVQPLFYPVKIGPHRIIVRFQSVPIGVFASAVVVITPLPDESVTLGGNTQALLGAF